MESVRRHGGDRERDHDAFSGVYASAWALSTRLGVQRIVSFVKVATMTSDRELFRPCTTGAGT